MTYKPDNIFAPPAGDAPRKKVLVVGAGSAVAGMLIPALAMSCDVISAGRKDADIVLDLSAGIDALPPGLDTIILVAASFGGKTDAEILDAEYVNALGTLKLCQAAVKAGVKHLIIISSIFTLLDANAAFHGIYALSKRHADELAQFYCAERRLPLCILRPSQIYGDSDAFRRNQPFFYHLLDQAQRGEEVTLYGSHDARRNYIHVDDVVKIILHVVQRKSEGAYTCAFPSDTTYSHIAEAAFAAFGTEKRIRFLRDKADQPDNIFEPDDRLYKEIGFRPKISIEAGILGVALHRAENP